MARFKLNTVPTIRLILVGFFLALSGFALLELLDNYRAMKSAERLGTVGRVLVALDKGTIEMSFERSLTQVGLSLPDPFGPPFSDLLLQQRQRSDAQLDGIAPLLATLPPAKVAAAQTALVAHRTKIADLRRAADAALALPVDQRVPNVASTVPEGLKAEILLLREVGQKLASPDGSMPVMALSLASIADAGWRIREFGGRERTYLAIAALTGAPIPAASLIEARRDDAQAEQARRQLERVLDIDGKALPEGVREAADTMIATYFGSYAALKAAFLGQAEQPTPAYPLGFEDYFAQSSAALDTAVSLTYAAGDASSAFWDAEQRSARFGFGASIGGIVLLFAVVGFAWRLVERRLVKPVIHAQHSAERIAQLDLDSPIQASGTDELGRLLASLDKMRRELKSRIEREREVATENARVRNALDAAASGMLIADADRRVVYMNPAVERMLRGAESELRAKLPGFDVARVLGGSIDLFGHVQSAGTSSAAAQGPVPSRLRVGDFDFELIESPIIEDGRRVGVALEWLDRSSETNFRHGLRNVAQKAAAGILTARMSVESRNERFVETAQIFNSLMEITTQAIDEVRRTLSALAERDLTVRSQARMMGSFGELNANANAAADALALALGEVQQAVGAIHEAATEIASGNIDLSKRTEQAAASIQQTAAAMEQMTKTMARSVEHAQQAKQIATYAAGVASEGGQTVDAVVRMMRDIEERSRRMADITTTIDGIAFQTNILALNAAVEAARAGEQGRGFAVVAAEVRALAQRSATAAKEIAQLIGESVTKIADGASVAERAGRTMQDILGSSRRVSDIIGEISAASAEQAKGIGEVNQAVTQMDQSTQANSALVEQMAASAQSMSDQASQLAEIASRFVLVPSEPLALTTTRT
ncbi:MAG: HAMP domain-containing protein [Xanthomonadales bacterium]|nr:HAMP domain-containing protein [Xanthomonadales bacterium]